MAVKPITNKQTINTSAINRATQRSFRNDKVGNAKQGIVPGKDFTKGFSVTLRDIDESVVGHMKNVMKFTAKIFKMENITFGDIRCYAKNLEPTTKNKKMLLNKYTIDPLSTETKQNSFVVAYEDADKINVEDIIDYCNKWSGSL